MNGQQTEKEHIRHTQRNHTILPAGRIRTRIAAHNVQNEVSRKKTTFSIYANETILFCFFWLILFSFPRRCRRRRHRLLPFVKRKYYADFVSSCSCMFG
jgi:hypothetical protein